MIKITNYFLSVFCYICFELNPASKLDINFYYDAFRYYPRQIKFTGILLGS